tara:strand:+ start:538 stop:744 length:207 start_codon:yes stop_codon:yes gene_type:complete
MRVNVRRNNFDVALKIFKRKVKESGKLNVYRDKEFYEKPSETRNKAKSAAKLREQRRQNAIDKSRKSY